MKTIQERAREEAESYYSPLAGYKSLHKKQFEQSLLRFLVTEARPIVGALNDAKNIISLLSLTNTINPKNIERIEKIIAHWRQIEKEVVK